MYDPNMPGAKMPDRITDGPRTPEDYDDVYGYHEPPDRTDEMRQEQTDRRGQLVYRLEHMIHNIYAKPAFDIQDMTKLLKDARDYIRDHD